MVIRRIREHIAAQNWFAVGIDFLIVVAGIVIGTQVNNWNQARIERRQGAEYRERLIADLRANEAEMINLQSYFTTVRNHAEGALSALERPVGADGNAFLVDAYEASQIQPRKATRFTFDELNSAGRFEQLGDARLREQVANYYVTMNAHSVTFDFVPPYREHIRALMPNAAQRAIRTQCPIFTFASDGSAAASRRKRCMIKLEASETAKAVVALRASPTLPAELTRQIADLDVKLTLTEVAIRRARQVRALIETKQHGTS